ncbi:T3SS effector HopA1 family protein [Nocardioides insulae]|uniref:T3SS effector HopA1 family protein n=1 Tax=Nocardioides insulae TaxID=394734 RepID=UPI0012F9A414|nr:T3SS effector HopA1 family protein [Nocardioides insulae]
MIPSTVLADLTGLLSLVRVEGGGLRIGENVVPGAAGAGVGDDEVCDALYVQWYLGGAPAAGAPPDPTEEALLGGRLVGYLRAAHAGTRLFGPGWVVLTRGEHGECLVGRGEERRVVHHTEYVSVSRPGVPVAPGEQVAVTMRVDTTDDATRWWATRSPQGEPEGPLGRFYLHPYADSAPAVVHELTTRLLASDLRWSIKASTDPRGYRRPDAIVLYTPREDSQTACAAVTDLTSGLGTDSLQSSAPPLTMPIASGVGYAEDPGPDISFGTSRCRALTTGVRAVATEGLTGQDAVRALTESLAAAGIDPTRPWREPVP